VEDLSNFYDPFTAPDVAGAVVACPTCGTPVGEVEAPRTPHAVMRLMCPCGTVLEVFPEPPTEE
jgi:hypothetical protein